MDYHPYTDIWPLLEGPDFDALVADIKAGGLRLPIITYQDKILDGRNRDRACQAAGVEPRYVPAFDIKTDAQALELVVSLNEHRRHLTLAQRAFAASRLATLKNGQRPALAEERAGQITIKEAAKAVGSSWGSADRARTIHLHGTPEDEAEVVSGRTTLTQKAAELTGRARAAGPPKAARRPSGSVQAGITAARRHVMNIPKGLKLTPKEVDPEFTGTPIEFTDLYGHVQVMTAKDYATMRFGDWAGNIAFIAREWRKLPWPDREVDLNWLRDPKPKHVAKLTEALEFLRPQIAKAEELLARAAAALNK